MTATTALVLGTVVSLAATGASTYMSYQAEQKNAEAAEDAAKYNAAVQNNSAMMAEQQAAYEADRIRDQNRRRMASQTSALAKAGVDISGTAQDLAYDSSIQGEMDRLAALYTGKVQSTELRAGAGMTRLEGKNAAAAHRRNAGATIVSGIASSANTVSTSPYFKRNA